MCGKTYVSKGYIGMQAIRECAQKGSMPPLPRNVGLPQELKTVYGGQAGAFLYVKRE